MIEEKEIKVSTTDPESGYLRRQGKPEGFSYLDHRTVDGKHNIIVDTYVTPGNVHDASPYLQRLDRQRERFGFEVEAVALDAGYLTTVICKGLQDRGIKGAIAHRRFHPTKGLFAKWKFKYDSEEDCYYCPEGNPLQYGTTNRGGYREYHSDPKICRECPSQLQCTRSRNCRKTITRHVWEDSKDWVREFRLSDEGKEIYDRRKETIERSFADAKQLHGLRYCRFRGRSNVQEQVLLTAACQNMKKIATYLANVG